MYKMNIDYGNCNSTYTYETREELNKKLDNLIWVWDLEKVNDNTYTSPAGDIITVVN